MGLKYEVRYDTEECAMGYRRHEAYHRIGGPAIMWDDGDMRWCQYGQRHRDDGPVYSTYQLYYFRGLEYTKLEFNMISFYIRMKNLYNRCKRIINIHS